MLQLVARWTGITGQASLDWDAYRSRSARESTLMTPSEAAPEVGLRTAGKPTTSAARFRSAGDVTAKFLGVGSPAAFITSLVLCIQSSVNALIQGAACNASCYLQLSLTCLVHSKQLERPVQSRNELHQMR